MTEPSPPNLDLALLRGFRYSCRPDCGLCCYAEPRVAEAERAGLLSIAPETEWVGRSGATFLRARPEGGGCQFLRGTRCRVWPARPGPCQEFPVSVHVGERLQATLVLTCPGIDLAPLTELASWEERPEPVGFGAELDSLTRRVDATVRRDIEAATRRRRRIRVELNRTGQWTDEADVRAAFRERPPWPAREDFPVADPPAADGELEYLPLFFDERPGPLAFAEGLGGWEVLELRPEGGREPPLAVVAPPTRPPEVSPTGRRLLEGYLRYFLARDALFGTVLSDIEVGGPNSVLEEVEAELRAIGAVVLSRADVRRKAFGSSSGPLSESDVVNGIRATDQDLLDRPTWGDRL